MKKQIDTTQEQSKGIFSTSLFGFSKKNVLNYINELHSEKAKELEKLEQQSFEVKSNLEEEVTSTKEKLKKVTDKLYERINENTHLTSKIDEYEVVINDYKNTLISKDNEFETLKEKCINLENDKKQLLTQMLQIKSAVEKETARIKEKELSMQQQVDNALSREKELNSIISEQNEVSSEKANEIILEANNVAKQIIAEAEQRLDKINTEIEKNKNYVSYNANEVNYTVYMLKEKIENLENEIQTSSAKIKTVLNNVQNSASEFEKRVSFIHNM